jgi:tetratricopeptide (TPR) repeat protein
MTDAAMDRAAQCFKDGDFSSAEALYTTVIGIQPTHAKALSNRAAVYLKLGDNRRALTDADACVKSDPSFAKGWGRKAAALAGLKHYADAITAYERALALEPTNTMYRDEIKNFQRLIADGRGVASDEGREAYYFRRSVDQGVQAMKDGKHDEAIRHFTKAIAQSSVAQDELHVLYANRSAAHLRAGHTLDALDDALDSVKASSTYARGHARLAAAYLARGNVSDAADSAKRALQLDPTCAPAKETLTQVESQARAQAASLSKAQADAEALRKNIAEAQQSAHEMDASAPVSRAANPSKDTIPTASRHAVSYAYCRVCSEYGHVARDCPLRKR